MARVGTGDGMLPEILVSTYRVDVALLLAEGDAVAVPVGTTPTAASSRSPTDPWDVLPVTASGSSDRTRRASADRSSETGNAGTCTESSASVSTRTALRTRRTARRRILPSESVEMVVVHDAEAGQPGGLLGAELSGYAEIRS